MNALEQALSILDNDIEALGWDQPATLYGIEGDIDDPVFIKQFELGNARTELEEMTHVVRAPTHAVGLVLVTEAWRTASLEEVRNGPDCDGLVEAIERDIREIEAAGGEATAAHFVNMLHEMSKGRISELPEPLRRESRVLIAVMKNGEARQLIRTRGQGVESYPSADGAVPDLLKTLLEPCPCGEVHE